MVKNLAFQLLERSVGDINFYEKLVKAFEAHSEYREPQKLEHSLWEALETAFTKISKNNVNLVVFVDGVDEIPNVDVEHAMLKRLYKSVERFHNIRAIVITAKAPSLKGTGCRFHEVDARSVHDDLSTHLRHVFSKKSYYTKESDEKQHQLVDELVHKAKGSWLWIKLAAAILVKENSYEHLKNAGKALPASIESLVHHLIDHVDLKNATTKRLFEFMLVAKRPFTVQEMTELLEINLEKRTLGSNFNLRQHIANTCSLLVVEKKGLIRFQHSFIRKHVQELFGKKLLSVPEAQRELTLRILLYSKLCISTSHEPTFDGLGGDVLEGMFRSYVLLEYAVRYWVIHFKSSTLLGSKGQLTLPSHFKDCFPSSVTFSMMQWSCWQAQYTVEETLHYHDLVLHIGTSCFGEKNDSVMQSLIILGTLYRSISNTDKAADYFYRASRVGATVLYKFSTVVVTCTTLFLTITETITITKRTEIVTYREEMIKFMIEICKEKHGASSDAVIRWYKVLAKLYIDIKEEHKATVIYKELHRIIVIRFGPKSKEAAEIGGALGGLKVVLHDDSHDDVVEYNQWIFETTDELEVHDEHRISIILKLITSYEASGRLDLAERLFINLWVRISEITRVRASIEMIRIKIDITIAYVKFLQRLKRVEEASTILVCLWAEYEHHSFESELLIIRLKEIGRLCKSFGLLTVAVSIFSKVWGWFKSKGQTTHEEALAVTVLITEVVEEITETTTVTKTKTTTVTTETETVIREVFETTITRCQHGKVDAHFFKSCMALISLYIMQEKWSEVEIVIKRSLELTWKAVLTFDTKLTLTETYVSECIMVATQLAICYHRQRYFEKAESIYLRIYKACLTSLHVEHELLIKTSLALIHFYEEYHRHDKVIEIYIELHAHYKKHLGAGHKLTIKTLYALGSVCVLLGRKDAYSYYIEIVTTLNKGTHCHHDAFEAAIIVCKYYYEEKRWTELQQICAVLWETFKHHHHEYKFTAEMIQVLYERYVYVLEFHAKVEFSVLYKLTVEYRETVTKVFGVSAAIVITAMIALAHICEKSEKHYHESVTIYEEIITKIKTTKTVTTVETETITMTVKKRLSKMYVTIITSGSGTSHTTIERGIAICLEIYEHFKIEFGCWHETTLSKLRELVILYKKLNSQESHTRIITLLQISVLEILTTVTTSMTLFTAATTLASIYISVGMITYAENLLQQLRHQIILRDIGFGGEITIKIPGNVGKTSYVFLIAFERTLHEKIALSYSEIMIDIVAETFLIEQYTRSIKTSTTIELVLEYGAKLRAFWEFRRHTTLVSSLDKKLFETFKAKYGSIIQTHDTITFVFYVTLLHELGKDRSKVDFHAIVCRSSNAKVRALLEAGDFQQAHEVAKCAFQFIGAQRIYHHRHCITYGYKLAELLAGIDVRKTTDGKLRESMLETSRRIMRDVLVAFREEKIDFVTLKFEDLNGLVHLLGDQANYGELQVSFAGPQISSDLRIHTHFFQFLLESLWQSREVQKTWSSSTVLSIGRMLVHARYGNGHPKAAIELCDRICYNLRRSRGWLDKEALAMTELLTQLYATTGQYGEVMRVHEEVLREVDESDDDGYVDTANAHFVLLRAAFLRFGGKFAKHGSDVTYKQLHKRLQRYKGLDVSSIEKWHSHKLDKEGDEQGRYHLPKAWGLQRGDDTHINKTGGTGGLVPRKDHGTLRAASGRWYGPHNHWSETYVTA